MMTSPTRPMAWRIAGHHRERAEIVQQILGGDGLGPDARFGEGDVLGNLRVEMMADHQHVEMLVDGVDREGPGRDWWTRAARWPRRRRVMMSGAWPPPAPSLWKVWMVRPLNARMRVLDEAGLVERVGVDRDLHVEFVGHVEAGVDRRRAWCPNPRAASGRWRRRAPVRAAARASAQLPLPRKPRFIGYSSAASSMRCMFQMPGVQVVAFVPVAGPVPPPIMVVMPLASACSICCGQMKWMCVSMPPAVTMQPSPAMTSVAAPMTMPGVMPLWMQRISGVADADDAPVLDADVGLDDALHGIEDQRVGDDEIERFGVERGGRLPHAVADHFAAAEFHFVAVAAVFGDEIALDLDEEFGIGEADLVAHGRAEHFGVLSAA